MKLNLWEGKLTVCIVAVAAWLLVVIALPGCSMLESRELLVACRAADTVTTIQIVRNGGVERNPLLRNIVMGHHWLLFVGLEAAITWFVWSQWDDVPQVYKPAINILGCSPVPNNLLVLRGQ